MFGTIPSATKRCPKCQASQEVANEVCDCGHVFTDRLHAYHSLDFSDPAPFSSYVLGIGQVFIVIAIIFVLVSALFGEMPILYAIPASIFAMCQFYVFKAVRLYLESND